MKKWLAEMPATAVMLPFVPSGTTAPLAIVRPARSKLMEEKVPRELPVG